MKSLILAVIAVILLFGGEMQESHAATQAKLLFNGPGKNVVGFTRDGKLLAYVEALHSFFLYDLEKTINSGPGWKSPSQEKFVGGTLSPDRMVVALVFQAGREQSNIHLCNAVTGELLNPEFKTTDIAHVAFARDAKRLAGICPMNGTVRIWNAATGELLDSLSWAEPMQVVWTGLEFSPDGNYIAAQNSYAHAIWNLAARSMLGTSRVQHIYLAIDAQWNVALAALAPENRQGSFSPAKLVFPTEPLKPFESLKGMSPEVDLIAFSPDGAFAAVAATNKTIRIWNLRKEAPRQPVIPAKGAVVSMAISPDNSLLAIYEWISPGDRQMTRTVRIVDAHTGEPRSGIEKIKGLSPKWHFDKGNSFLACSFFGEAGPETLIWQFPQAAR